MVQLLQPAAADGYVRVRECGGQRIGYCATVIGLREEPALLRLRPIHRRQDVADGMIRARRQSQCRDSAGLGGDSIEPACLLRTIAQCLQAPCICLGDGRFCIRLTRGRHTAQQLAELEAGQELAQLGGVETSPGQVIGGLIHRDIAPDAGERLPQQRFILFAGQLPSRCRTDVIKVLIDAFNRPVSLEQSRSGLLTDAGDARDLVRTVAAETFEINKLCRCQAVFIFKACCIEIQHFLGAASRDEDADAVVKQLQQVVIAADDHRLVALAGGTGCERADDVIRLIARLFQRDHPHRVHHLPNNRQLASQVLIHLRPAGLVSLIHLVAERRPRRVEDHRDLVRALLLQQCQEHLCQAEHRVRRPAVTRAQMRERVVGPMDETVGIYEQEFACHA